MISLVEKNRYKKSIKDITSKNKSLLKTIDKVLDIFKQNTAHPSLKFKKITCKRRDNLYSIRVNDTFRILLEKHKNDFYTLENILDHKAYDRAVKPQNC
jgi:plasmid maintenance system killer protein